jgi:hypothetical protein
MVRCRGAFLRLANGATASFTGLLLQGSQREANRGTQPSGVDAPEDCAFGLAALIRFVRDFRVS